MLFKQEEKEKSEATAKTLDLGKNVFAWNVFMVRTCLRGMYSLLFIIVYGIISMNVFV